MIRPSRHMDLASSPLRLAQIVLQELAPASAMRLTELQDAVFARIGRDADRSLITALELLFLMGLLEYDEGDDAVWLRKLSEAQ